MIPTRVHGVLDYFIGALLIVAPWVLGFASNGPATWVPVILGASVIVYSALTRYEVGLVKAIPMPVHLVLDGLGGLLLIASPWIFQFDGEVWAPHVVVGSVEVLAAMFTRRRPVVSTPLPRHDLEKGDPATNPGRRAAGRPAGGARLSVLSKVSIRLLTPTSSATVTGCHWVPGSRCRSRRSRRPMRALASAHRIGLWPGLRCSRAR